MKKYLALLAFLAFLQPVSVIAAPYANFIFEMAPFTINQGVSGADLRAYETLSSVQFWHVKINEKN
jgi:hypothetical protein